MDRPHSQKLADIIYRPIRKPSEAARALLVTWAARRQGGHLPRLSEFSLEDMRPWLGGLVVMSHASATPRIEIYGGSLSAAVGQFFSGALRPDWPGWVPAITWRNVARLRHSAEPFIEQVWLKDRDVLRVYDRLVMPVAGSGGELEGCITFIDNRRHLRPSARAGLLIDH
jgi:hypothetical protein